MSTLTLELSDELAARLTAASERAQLPPAQFVTAALEKTLPPANADGGTTTQPSALVMLHDLVGCFDGPSDLSTNPRYLEGLGSRRE